MKTVYGWKRAPLEFCRLLKEEFPNGAATELTTVRD
jgi:hypothetical protein